MCGAAKPGWYLLTDMHGEILNYLKKQWPILLVLLLLTPLGFATKFYTGPGRVWVHAYAGDILYPMFWYFIAVLFFPDVRPASLCLLVFLFSTLIEFSQLGNGDALLWLRQSFLGRTLVGVSFSLVDILYYYVGSMLAVFLHLALYFYALPVSASEPKGHHHAF